MGPLLEMQGVSAGYRGRDVLRDVSLRVGQGELWAILGPNGAGKSTLVRVGMGLLPPRAGAVRLRGKDLSAHSRAELSRLEAWVPQAMDLLPAFSGLELALMGRSPHLGRLGLPSQADLARAREVLRELSVEHLACRPVTRVSGGERRLLFLARALLQDPALLWLDEPTAFLDLRHQVETLGRVRDRVRRGASAVAVLHDVNLAMAFADQVLLLQAGEVLAQGEPREVLTPERLQALFGVSMISAEWERGHRLFAPRPSP